MISDPVNDTALTPDRIMQIGMGFWAAKVVLSATRLGLFAALAPGPAPASARP